MVLFFRLISKNVLLSLCFIFNGILTQIVLPPGDSLNKALEAFASSINSLRADMNEVSPARITKLEKELNDTIKAVNARFAQVENKVASAERNILSILNERLPNIETNVQKLDGKVERLDDKESEGAVKIGVLKADTDRLDNANKIWRNNFRVISNTFTTLRKTVSFNAPGRLS